MQYYTKRRTNKYIVALAAIILIIVAFNITMGVFNKRVMPSITEIAIMMAKSQTLDIINKKSVDTLSQEFNYNEMIKIEKDNEGNIILVQADTIKLNYIAAKLSTECNKELRNMNNEAIKVPFGWLSSNGAFFNLGPKITVQMEPVGNVRTSYESKFESAGINQTRHKIYLNIIARTRLKLPMKTQDVEVSTQIPVSDTIIVGKIPNTTFGYTKDK